MEFKVLGSGCANSHTLESRTTVDTPHTLGVDLPVDKVTDYGDIASYGVVSTPALAIDDQVVFAGRVPSHAELVDLREVNR
jgi:small redox-active disulfide protein 2